VRVILYQPQIPANTGNIVRTCSVTGTGLRLVRPLGFRTSDRMLKRAGLDYWEGVDIEFIDDFETYLEQSPHPFYFFSSKATRSYRDIDYTPSDLLIFGSETTGLPDHFYERWPERFVTIPMKNPGRCLNLSNCAAIAIYEALDPNTQRKSESAKLTMSDVVKGR